MTNKGLSKIALLILDRLTDSFPFAVPHLFQSVFLTILGNGAVYRLIAMKYRRSLTHCGGIAAILLVADMGIGDAIMLQPAIAVLRRYYPHARIDYVCNTFAGDLISGNPNVDRIFPIFTVNGRLLDRDRTALRAIETQGKYSLILNLCPFIDKKTWQNEGAIVDLYIPFASNLIRSLLLGSGRMHISYRIERFLTRFLASSKPTTRIPGTPEQIPDPGPVEGNAIYLSDGALEDAQVFLANHGLFREDRILFYNPDTSSPYTRIPLEVQKKLLVGIVEIGDLDAILLGTGFATWDIERALLATVPQRLRRKIVLVPPQPLGVYAAILDACDMYLSGDGGPLHIAAAWKISASPALRARNRTSVVSVFGATDSRMYGYDSQRPDHIPGSQRAPSKAFVASAPCRNITCVNKLGKTCKDIRCFAGLDTRLVTAYIRSYFESLGHHPFSVRAPSGYDHA